MSKYTISPVCNVYTLYQDKLTADKKPTVRYSMPDEIPTTCFQSQTINNSKNTK